MDSTALEKVWVILSASAEDYLETILELTEAGTAARVTDIAQKMGIAKPSVTEAVVTLKERGLVSQERYGQISLTAQGLLEAKRVRRRHLVLRTFLRDVLGVDEKQAEADACQIEHVVSAKTMERMVAFLERGLLTVDSEKDPGV